MREICILTEDKRLKRELTLLLQKEYEVTENPKDALLIADADTVDASFADLVISYENMPTNAPLLKRPFSAKALQELLSSLQNGKHERLTPTEEKLFTLLKEANGNPIPREKLIREVWGEQGTEGLLNLYIHYLREKLEKDGVRRIFASRGKGYYYKC